MVSDATTKPRTPDTADHLRRMEAFLALIRYAEAGKQERPDAYRLTYGGGHFTSFADHPRKTVNRWKHRSAAAGAYGITEKTYDEAVKRGVAHDFSPSSQDDIAESLIRSEGAQWDIYDGDLDAAFRALHRRWSSLPGGSQQEISAAEAKQYFWQQLGEPAP